MEKVALSIKPRFSLVGIVGTVSIYDQRYLARNSEEHKYALGGACANILIVYGALKKNIADIAPCAMIGTYATDKFGAYVCGGLHFKDIDVTRVRTNAMTVTPITAVERKLCEDENGKLFAEYSFEKTGLSRSHDRLEKEDISIISQSKSAVINIDHRLLRETARICKDNNTAYFVSLNGIQEHHDLDTIIDYPPHTVMCNQQESAIVLSRIPNFYNSMNELGTTVIVTRKTAGAIVYDRGQTIEIPAIRFENEQDSFGCGSAFFGGYIYAIHKAYLPTMACQFGIARAALKSLHLGVAGNPYTEEQVVRLLQEKNILPSEQKLQEVLLKNY